MNGIKIWYVYIEIHNMEEVSLLSHHIGPQISTDLLGLRSYTFQGFPSGCQGRRGSPRWPGRNRRPDWANWAKLGPRLVASRARNALNLQWTQWTLPILQCCANTTGYVLRTPCHRDCSNVTHARRNRDKSQSKCKRYSTRQNYGKKKRFNLQAPPVYDRKVTNLFFFHNYFFHNYFFFHNSVGDCMSIDSQFECILRGNIEL